MGLLEFGGYALHSSYVYPHNSIDRLFSERNFSLAMVLFFSAYFPLLKRPGERPPRQAVRVPGSGSRGYPPCPT